MFEYHGFMLNESISFLNLRFENDVKTYGTQAHLVHHRKHREFENDVKTYGTQAVNSGKQCFGWFENDVKTYGTQATGISIEVPCSLRMM